MPALNTPQFGLVKSRLPHKAQPVPPIFQPEVAAEAIKWVANHPRQELWVGASTYKAILAQRLIPRLLDLYLAKTGYQAQKQEDTADPNRPDDLWAPAGGDPGAHGSFDDRAYSRSWALKLTKNRGWLAAGGIVPGAVTAFKKYEKHCARDCEA